MLKKCPVWQIQPSARFKHHRYHFKIEGNMMLSGYADAGLSVEELVPATLAEVTVCATPAELRRMAEFLTFCASEMDRMGEIYDHVHLSDLMKEFHNSPHLVVARAVENAR